MAVQVVVELNQFDGAHVIGNKGEVEVIVLDWSKVGFDLAADQLLLAAVEAADIPLEEKARIRAVLQNIWNPDTHD